MQAEIGREKSRDAVPQPGPLGEAASPESIEWRVAVSNLCTYTAWLDRYGSWRNFLLNLPRKRP